MHEPLVYFLIQAYKKEVDEQYERHLYPSYLTAYYLEKGGKGFGLQSRMHDAVKFVFGKTAREWKEYAENAYPDREFDIVPVDARLFGKVKPKYIIETVQVKGIVGSSHSEPPKTNSEPEIHQVEHKPKTLDDILKMMDENY